MNKYKGIFYAILSSAAFGVMPTFSRIAYSHGSNPTTVLFFRFLIASIILFVYLFYKKISIKVSKYQFIILILTGLTGYTVTTQTLFIAYNSLGGGLATTLHFIYPSIVCILSFILFKDSLTFKKILSLIIAAFGVYALIAFESHTLDILGVTLALISGVTYAVNIIVLGLKSIKDIDYKVVTMYVCIGACLGMILIGIYSNSLSFDLNLTLAGCYLGISTISTIASMILLMKAIALIGASSASILGTFEPIVSIVLGIILVNENLSFSLILGTTLILISTIILTSDNSSADENNKHNLNLTKEPQTA